MIYHGEPRAQRYLLVADSVHQWKLEISAEEASKLLNGLLEVASLSRLNADSLSRDRRLDVNPSVKSQPAPTTGLQGRVVYLVMVDSTGVADMGTYSTVIASDSLVEADARRVAAGSRFKPGMEAGHPVRVLVCQTISWLLGPPH